MRTPRKKRRTIRQYANQLRKELPLDHPVEVHVSEMPKDGEKDEHWRRFGDSTTDGKKYYIRINRVWPVNIQKDVLEHEWAHCLIPWEDTHDHSDEWGRAYARVLRVTYGWEDLK